MDLRYLKFTLALFFAERIWSLPLGCLYNGTTFGEGEAVRTEEPCLSCVCQGGALECSLRVCADQPNVLPPGCFFLHKPNECCPQLFCEENFDLPGVELRTGLKLENKINGNDCTINGSRYAEGSAVASSQVCEYCYCVDGETKCIKPRCPQSFEGCRAVYEKSSCCPTQYDCRDADIILLNTQIQNFVLANPDSKYSNNSLRTLSNLHVESEKTNSSDSESSENLTEKEEQSRENIGGTTTEEINTEETTVEADTEATTLTEDDLTSSDFQTMTTEYFNKESTMGEIAEQETTTEALPSAKSSNPQNGYDYPEGAGSPAAPKNDSRSDSSQEGDDYEAYDYGEPRLPPSLPNLIIFPFVAADAVVKDDTGSILHQHDKMEIKRMDSRPVFYKDHFSPPVKTEGGFVPKAPFYEQTYFREDQMESPGVDSNVGQLCRNVPCPFLGFDNQWAKITAPTTTASDIESVKPSFKVDLVPLTEPTIDFIFKDELSAFQKSEQTKKPVTVTYKNIVVDFYPNYLITTTRARPKTQPVGNLTTSTPVPKGPNEPAKKIQNALLKTSDDTKLGVSEDAVSSTHPLTWTTLEPASTGTTAESSLFEEFLKSFLSGEITSTTAATTMMSTKHKYSSKIKGNANVVRDHGSHKRKSEFSKTTSSTDSALNTVIRTEYSATDEKKAEPATRTKDGIKSFTEEPINLFRPTTEPAKTNREAVGFFQGAEKYGPSSQKRKQEGTREESNSQKPDAGTLLKLAGCNIYGMMYRVGKLIAELSGPCLECLCTDLGVQCRPLGC